MNVVLHDHNLFLISVGFNTKLKGGWGGSVFTFPVQTYISKMLFSLEPLPSLKGVLTLEAYKIKKPELHS